MNKREQLKELVREILRDIDFTNYSWLTSARINNLSEKQINKLYQTIKTWCKKYGI